MKTHKRLTGRAVIALLRNDSITPTQSLAVARELSMRRGVRHAFSGRNAKQRVYQRSVGGEMGGDFMPPDLTTDRQISGEVVLSRAEKKVLAAKGRLSFGDTTMTVNRNGKRVPFVPKALSSSDPCVKAAARLLAPFQNARKTMSASQLQMERRKFEAKMGGYLSKGIESFKTVGTDGADDSKRPPVVITEK